MLHVSLSNMYLLSVGRECENITGNFQATYRNVQKANIYRTRIVHNVSFWVKYVYIRSHYGCGDILLVEIIWIIFCRNQHPADIKQLVSCLGSVLPAHCRSSQQHVPPRFRWYTPLSQEEQWVITQFYWNYWFGVILLSKFLTFAVRVYMWRRSDSINVENLRVLFSNYCMISVLNAWLYLCHCCLLMRLLFHGTIVRFEELARVFGLY